MVISIIAVLLAILLPTLASVKRQGKRAVELSAMRQLMTSFGAYTFDHDDAVLPGTYLRSDPTFISTIAPNTYDQFGAPLTSFSDRLQATRWPFRLGPYFDYKWDGVTHVNEQARGIVVGDENALLTDIADFYNEGRGSVFKFWIATYPSLGYNAEFVGGNADFGGTQPQSEIYRQREYIVRTSDAASPTELVGFASAYFDGFFDVRDDDGEPTGVRLHSKTIQGHHLVTLPTDRWRGTEIEPNNYFGHVHPRYEGSSLLAMLDGHAETRESDELTDARLWSNTAREQNNRDWQPPVSPGP